MPEQLTLEQIGLEAALRIAASSRPDRVRFDAQDESIYRAWERSQFRLRRRWWTPVDQEERRHDR